MASSRPQILKKIGLVLVGVGMMAGLAVLVLDFMHREGTPKRQVVTTITTVKLPPPPPPPPPKEPPPEPPKLEEPKIKEPDPIKPEAQKPEPAPVPPPPGLGFEGQGGPGGYGNIGVAGSGTGIGGGGGGGTGGSILAWYAGYVVKAIQEALQKNDATRAGSYRLVVKLWLDPRGAVTRSQLVSSSGDAEQDAAITRVLNGLVLTEAPPADMPQPVQVRITARRPA